jgi:hypothetical protein
MEPRRLDRAFGPGWRGSGILSPEGVRNDAAEKPAKAL